MSSALNLLWSQAEEVINPENAPDPVEQALALNHIEAELKAMEGTHAEKCLALACLIKNIEGEAEAIKAEAQKLAGRQKSAERKAEWLRTYLAGNMEPGTNLRDARAAIGWRKSAGVVLLVAPEQLPTAFQRTKTIVDPDKTAIKDALTVDPKNAELAGKAVIEARFNLQIT